MLTTIIRGFLSRKISNLLIKVALTAADIHDALKQLPEISVAALLKTARHPSQIPFGYIHETVASPNNGNVLPPAIGHGSQSDNHIGVVMVHTSFYLPVTLLAN